MFPGIADQVLPAPKLPGAPRGQDPDARGERLVGQLEADLVVALAGGAVSDAVGPPFPGDPDLLPSDHGTRQRGSQQVLAFVDGVGLDRGKDELFHEGAPQVRDHDLVGAGPARLFPDLFQVLPLPHIGQESQDRTSMLRLQPMEHGGSIQSARIGQDDLLYLLHQLDPFRA